MARNRRFLNGAAKDAFLLRVLASEPSLDAEARERLALALQEAIAMIGTRAPTRLQETCTASKDATAEASVEETGEAAVAAAPPPEAEPPAQPFDPYSPNVIVVFRTRGRDAVLQELHSIEDVDCLRLLAREQQLGIAADLADPTAIRQAIVAAAERRVANRRAAAS